MSATNRLRPAVLLSVLSGALLVVLACTSSGSGDPPYPFTPVSLTPERGQLAPVFPISLYQEGNAFGGGDLNFSDLLGKRPIVLNFWAGLCPPCRAEMPDLQAMYDENGDRVQLFGLDVGPFVGLGSREDGRQLLEELKITFPTGTTFNAQIIRDYKLLGMPTTYFIKPDGTIHRQWSGLLTRKKLDELVNELLAASRSKG